MLIFWGKRKDSIRYTKSKFGVLLNLKIAEGKTLSAIFFIPSIKDVFIQSRVSYLINWIRYMTATNKISLCVKEFQTCEICRYLVSNPWQESGKKIHAEISWQKLDYILEKWWKSKRSAQNEKYTMIEMMTSVFILLSFLTGSNR